MKRFKSIFLLSALFTATAAAQKPPPEVLHYADTVFYNGKVVTADEKFSIAQAVAVRDGKILKVGETEAVLPLAGPKTRKIDLQGKTVIPGIIDTHTHLHEYGLEHWGPEMNPKLSEVLLVGRTKEDLLEQMKQHAAKRKPGEWLRFRLKPRSVADEFVDTLSRRDLDRATPHNPALAHATDTRAIGNTPAIEALLRKYDAKVLNLPVDAKGEITGKLGGGISLIFYEEIIPKPKPEELAPIYLKELEEWAAGGVTTWSSSLGSEAISAFHYMDQRGMLPIRLAYTNEALFRDNLYAESAVNRFGNLIGYGTDYFWLIGISSGSTDASYPGVCTTLEAKAEVKAREDCRLTLDNVRGRAAYAAVKAGLRIAGTHSAGDKATDVLLDIIEKASAEAGMTVEQIRAKRHVIDHCTLNPRPEQIERAKKLGIIWSCAPKYLMRAHRVMRDYGEAPAHNWVVPVKSILDAGGRAVFEQDHHEGAQPFDNLAVLVTRKDKEGRVWGAKQAVDRKTALLMATRWAAEYVLREDRLGSLEPGKWADLVVLDKDYFTVAEDEIASVKSVLTMVGGKIVYDGMQP